MIAEDPDGCSIASPNYCGKPFDWCALGHKTMAALWIFNRSCYYPAVGRAGVVVLAVVLSGTQSSLLHNMGCGSL